MIYKYTPDTYDYNLIKKLNLNEDEFLKLQLKYREEFESFLKKIVSFSSFDQLLTKENIKILEIEDKNDNFYHKFSSLNSKYLFLRNNYHIERLKEKDLDVLKGSLFDDKKLEENFILKTFKEVLFEDGDQAMFGVPMLKNLANSKSLVFELAYDDKLCSVEESKIIRKFYENTLVKLQKFLKNELNVDVNIIINDGF